MTAVLGIRVKKRCCELNASLMNFGPLDLKDRRLCGTVAPGRV